MKFHLCHYCGSFNVIKYFIAKCDTCKVQYHINRDDTLGVIIYVFNDEIFEGLAIAYNYTSIYYRNDCYDSLHLKEIFPYPHPSKALKLAKQLHNLKIFL